MRQLAISNSLLFELKLTKLTKVSEVLSKKINFANVRQILIKLFPIVPITNRKRILNYRIVCILFVNNLKALKKK